ncbi:MAG: hypothetical protein HON98_04660 [Chloroflexi bacterium]|jgi:hypothetical protein|nr:hypothetical protein [Chloroflexota bacterium]MBT3671170.1 hypothetical protein [Chloroflexota bacterium]MBT4002549.1 hypothetical protein [Chloroflexota bacterium]MBT4304371.1 hypothetical protein [Chloroflexota bacterium]MBT4534390.1 hypothetical protein [Chloroflexota bacterium]
MEIIGLVIASVLTILVLLYAFGDNVFFRTAIHVFIGVAAGYAGAVAISNVLIPQIMNLTFSGLAVPLLLIGMLLMKISPKTSMLGNPASAFLVGVGAAIAVGGAIQGTLLPQINGASNYFNSGLIQGILILIGATTTLISFHFSTKISPNQIPERNLIMEWISSVGKVFIAITFGVIFAGVYSSAMTALVERFVFLSDVFTQIMTIAGVQ